MKLSADSATRTMQSKQHNAAMQQCSPRGGGGDAESRNRTDASVLLLHARGCNGPKNGPSNGPSNSSSGPPRQMIQLAYVECCAPMSCLTNMNGSGHVHQWDSVLA